MPYTSSEQRQRLVELGYDPDKFEIVPADEAFGSAGAEPQGPLKPRLESSAGGAFLRGAKRAAIPAAAGILGAASTLKLIPTPWTQAIGWPATVLAPIVAGIGAGAGAAAIQEKVKPTTPEQAEQIQADVEQHPVATIGGELAPNLLAFKPSLSNIRTAFRKLPAAGADDAGRQAILGQRLNVGLGAGLGALQETALPAFRGEDIDLKRVLAATIGGGLINEPHRVGRRLGFTPSTGRLEARMGTETPPVTPDVAPTPETLAQQIERRLMPQDSSMTRAYRAKFGGESAPHRVPDRNVIFVDDQGVAARGQTPKRVDVPQDQRALPPAGADEQRALALEREIDQLEARYRHLPLQERLPIQAQIRKMRQELQQALQQRFAAQRQPQMAPPTPEQALAAQISEQFPTKKAVNTVAAGDTGVRIFPPSKRPVRVDDEGVPINEAQATTIAPVAEGSVTQPEVARPVLPAATSGPTQQELRFQQESALATQPIEQLLQHPTNQKVFNLLSGIAAQKNIEVAIGETDGALGMADLRKRIVTLNPKAVAEDTQSHEIAHILLKDMLHGNDPAAQQLAERGLAIFGGNEERLVQAIGTRMTDMAKIRVEGRTLQRFKAWLQDALSWMRKVWGGAKEEDFRRLLARRMLNGDTPAAVRSLPEGDAGIRYQRLVQTNEAVRQEIREMQAKANEVKDKNLPGIRSVIESVASRTEPQLAKGLSEADRLGTRYQADFQSRFESGIRLLTPDEQQSALDYLYNYKDTEGNPTVTPLNDKVQDFVENVVRPTMTHIADAAESKGKLIVTDGNGRQMKRMPWYFPEVPRQDALHEVRNKGNSPEAKKLMNDMYEHIAAKLNISKDSAADFYNDSHHAAAIFNEGESDFGPISRAAGIGLPASWRENSLQRALLRYARRTGRALGFFEGLEKDKLAGYLAGIKDQFGQPLPKPEGYTGRRFGDDREVVNALKWLRGDYEEIDQYIGVVSQVAKAGMLQTMTGMVDVLTGWVQVLPNMQVKDLPILAKSFRDVTGGIAKAIRMGVASQKSMMLAEPTESGQQFTGVAATVQKAHALADGIYKITGRDMMERWIRGWTYNAGEMLAWSKVGDAFSPESSKGDRKAAVLFLRDHAPEGWEKAIGDIITRGEQVPDSFIAEIAASVVERAQGTYSIRGLPSVALRGSFAPFLSLAKWNIEKWNNFNRQVIGQARRGNLTPLLMVTAGGVLGGEAVENLREAMTKRKPQHAEWEEIFNGAGEDLPYRLFALASYAGYGGILTEIGKQLYDVERGTPPTGFKFPAVELTSNIFHRVSQGMQAVNAGENMFDVFALQMPTQLAKDSVQLARIGIARTEQGGQEIERANLARDVRIFRRSTDLDVRGGPVASRNPFVFSQSRRFDLTESPAVAAEMAPRLTQSAFQRSGGDVEKLRRLLSALRTPTTDIVPNPRTSPREFAEYVQWVRSTQGEAAANELVKGYLQKQAMDTLKSRLVPRL